MASPHVSSEEDNSDGSDELDIGQENLLRNKKRLEKLQEDLEASVSEDSDSSSSSDEDAPRAAQRPAKKPRVDLATLEEQAADDGEEEVILLASDSSDDDGGAARAPPVRRLPVEAQNPKMQRLMQGKLRAQRRQLARKMKEKQEKRKREEVANRAAAEKLRVMKESNAGGDDLDALLANGGAGSGGGAGTGAGRGESLEFSVRSKSRSDPVSVTVWSDQTTSDLYSVVAKAFDASPDKITLLDADGEAVPRGVSLADTASSNLESGDAIDVVL